MQWTVVQQACQSYSRQHFLICACHSLKTAPHSPNVARCNIFGGRSTMPDQSFVGWSYKRKRALLHVLLFILGSLGSALVLIFGHQGVVVGGVPLRLQGLLLKALSFLQALRGWVQAPFGLVRSAQCLGDQGGLFRPCSSHGPPRGNQPRVPSRGPISRDHRRARGCQATWVLLRRSHCHPQRSQQRISTRSISSSSWNDPHRSCPHRHRSGRSHLAHLSIINWPTSAHRSSSTRSRSRAATRTISFSSCRGLVPACLRSWPAVPISLWPRCRSSSRWWVGAWHTALLRHWWQRALITPGHYVRSDSRETWAVASGLIPFSHPEEGVSLPLVHTRNGLATKTPEILVDHPGPWAPTRAMPDHRDPLCLQVLRADRRRGVHRVEQPRPQPSMDSAVPATHQRPPAVRVPSRHALELRAVPRSLRVSTSHGVPAQRTEPRGDGRGACQATVGSIVISASSHWAWFMFPRPLVMFLCWSCFTVFILHVSHRCQPFMATHPSRQSRQANSSGSFHQLAGSVLEHQSSKCNYRLNQATKPWCFIRHGKLGQT